MSVSTWSGVVTRVLATLALAFLSGVAVSTQAPVKVRTTLSRTAVWIGDRVIYNVELDAPAGMDIVDDDLASERLAVQGGEIVGFETHSDERSGRRLKRMQYTLVTYRIDAAEIRVPAFSVRYYARASGGAGSQIAPSGQLTVPQAVVAVRSALPAADGPRSPRVPGALQPSARYLRLAVPVGLVLMAVVIIPLTFAGAEVTGRARHALAARLARRRRRAQAVSLDVLSTIDVASETDRIAAFEQLDGLLRGHVALVSGAPAAALTPAELRQTLERSAPHLPVAEIESLLTRCEDARYARIPPSPDEWSSALADAESIVRARRR